VASRPLGTAIDTGADCFCVTMRRAAREFAATFVAARYTRRRRRICQTDSSVFRSRCLPVRARPPARTAPGKPKMFASRSHIYRTCPRRRMRSSAAHYLPDTCYEGEQIANSRKRSQQGRCHAARLILS
jgi:hypothetical protein